MWFLDALHIRKLKWRQQSWLFFIDFQPLGLFFFFFPQRCCYNSPKIIITSSDPRFAPKCKWNLLQNSNCCYWMCKAALDIVKINLYSSRNFNIRPSWLNGGQFLAWIHSGFTVNVDPTTTYEKKRYLTCYYCFHVLPKGTSMMNYQ